MNHRMTQCRSPGCIPFVIVPAQTVERNTKTLDSYIGRAVRIPHVQPHSQLHTCNVKISADSILRVNPVVLSKYGTNTGGKAEPWFIIVYSREPCQESEKRKMIQQNGLFSRNNGHHTVSIPHRHFRWEEGLYLVKFTRRKIDHVS